LFVYVFFVSNFTKRQKIGLISCTGIFVLLGFLFESSYLLPKIIIETFLFIKVKAVERYLYIYPLFVFFGYCSSVLVYTGTD